MPGLIAMRSRRSRTRHVLAGHGFFCAGAPQQLLACLAGRRHGQDNCSRFVPSLAMSRGLSLISTSVEAHPGFDFAPIPFKA